MHCRYPAYAQADCEIACDFAAKVGKPCALAETGIDAGIQDVTITDWYMSDLLENLLDYSSPTTSCQNLAYVLTWSNEQPERYVPTYNLLLHPPSVTHVRFHTSFLLRTPGG